MYPKEGLFVGDLGRTGEALTSRFMATPLTREISPTARSAGATLPAGFDVLAVSANGLLMLVGNDDMFFVISFDFNQVGGYMRAIRAEPYERNFENLGRNIKDEPVARGINWIMTKQFIMVVQPNGRLAVHSLHRTYVESSVGLHHFMLCTPHRNRGFSKGIPGGESNPFTGEPTDGYVPYASSEYIMRSMHDMLGHGGEMLCDWPQTVAYFLGNNNDVVNGYAFIADGFVVEYPYDFNHYESDPMRMYNYFPMGACPITPLEFHVHREAAPWFTPEDHAGGTPVYSLDYRVASAKGKLYARGMLTMGEACLIPAAFGEAGYPTEYFLYIANSHGFKSPYSPFANAPLQKDVVWENTQPMLLKDVNDPEQNFLAGITTVRVNPVYGEFGAFSTREGILLPDNTRYSIGQDVFYDRTSRTGLLLDDVGAMFFGGDIANGTISNLDEYECATIANWLAPTREIDSFSPKHVISLIYNGTLFTSIERDFVRDYVRAMPYSWAWGVFEKKQDAENPDAVTGRVKISPALFGQIVGTSEVGMPDDVDSVPFEEIPLGQAIKNPFRLSVLNLRINDTWVDDEGTHYVAWESVSDDCVLSKFDIDTNKRVYGGINPDTGEITESDSPGGIPEGWEAAIGDDVFGLKPHGAVYPLPSVGRYENFSPVEQEGAWGNFAVSVASDGMIQLVESSSGTRIAWRHKAFGEIKTHGGSWNDYGLTELVRSGIKTDQEFDVIVKCTEANRLGVILDNAPLPAYCSTMKHWGSDPVTDWLGRKKFLKTLTVWIVRPIYRYALHNGEVVEREIMRHFKDYLCIMRTDLDPSVFDFDAEMRRASSH